MHAIKREALILAALQKQGFLSFKEIFSFVDASSATLRRDLSRLAASGKLERVRGGVKIIGDSPGDIAANAGSISLTGGTFDENSKQHIDQKRQIAKAAAALCERGEGVILDGGTTTFHMCPHLQGMHLQVLTNSLHIVLSLIGQGDTRVMVPSGAVFPEQNIILPIFGEDGMPQFHASKLFMGASAISSRGLMQDDVVLVAAERRLINFAEKLIVLVDSSKFKAPSGHVVFALSQIDTIITDKGITDDARNMLADAGVNLIIAGC